MCHKCPIKHSLELTGVAFFGKLKELSLIWNDNVGHNCKESPASLFMDFVNVLKYNNNTGMEQKELDCICMRRTKTLFLQ